jgi:HK97 family phage major capsid protein
MEKIWMKDNEFTRLSVEEFGKLDDEQKNAYLIDQETEKESKLISLVEKMVNEKAASKESLENLTAAFEKQNSEEKWRQVETVLGNLQKGIESKANKSDGWKAMYDAFEGAKKSNKSKVAFDVIAKEIKANALRSSVDSHTLAYRLPDVGRLANPMPTFTDFYRVLNVPANNNGTIRYVDWDSTSVSRAAAAIAEGAVFPESTADWKEYSAKLEKVGDTIPVSEEFLDDVDFAREELVWFLQDNVERAINQYLYNGTGVTPQVSGIYTRVSAFAHATYTGPTTTTPDLMDLADILAKEILDTRDGKYSIANMVMFVNHDEYLELVLEKDTTGRRIRSNDDIMNSTIQIIPSSYVTANQAVIGDMRFARLYQNEAYNIEIGRDGNDFTYDLFTLKAKRRICPLIREADKDGFLKVTDIDAALTAITT